MEELIPTEYEEALTLVAYLETLKTQRKIVAFTHIANENNMRGGVLVAMQKKRMGVRKGFPDYLIITNKKMVAVELKRVKRAHISFEQEEWRRWLLNIGVAAAICHGFEEAKRFIEANL